MNHCFFTGRTTADPELRYSQNEDHTAVASASIAVDDGYGEKKVTSFFELSLFGKQAESFAKLVPKGTKIVVGGRARQSRWETKEGQKRSKVIFLVDRWEFAQSKESGEANANAADGFIDITPEDGLPF